MLPSVSSTPVLFIGPVEILVVGIVLLVIIFGSRAPAIAERAGESFGRFQQSKQEVEQEIEDVKEEVDDEIVDVKKDVQNDIEDVRSDIKEVEEELAVDDATASSNPEPTPEHKQ